MTDLIFSVERTINEKILGYPIRWFNKYSHYWLRPAIIIGLLLLVLALGYKNSTRYFQLMLLVVPGVLTVMAFMRWPPLGLVALIPSILVYRNGPSGVNITMGLVALLLGLWAVDALVRLRRIELPSTVTFWSLFVLIATACISFGLGQLPWYTFAQSAPLGAQLGGLAIYVLSAGAFLLVGYQIHDLRWLKAMVWIFLIVGGVYIFAQLGRLFFVNRFYSATINGSLFWTWLVTLAFGQALFNRKLHPSWRIALGVLALATFYVAYAQRSDWKSGWLPPLAAMGAMLAFRYWKLALVLSPLAVMPVSYIVTQAIATDQYSYSTRVEAWLIVVEIAKVNPILGLGFANYNWFTPLFPIRGYAVRFNSHSQFIDLIAQTGIIGLAAFLCFFAAVGWLGWQLRNHVPKGGFAEAYVYCGLGGLAATMVAAALGDWVLPFFYNIGMSGFRASVLSWLFLGGLVTLRQLYMTLPIPNQTTNEPLVDTTEV